MSVGEIRPPGQAESRHRKLRHNHAAGLYEAQGYVCAHCFEPLMCPAIAAAFALEFQGGHPDQPSLDRVVPGAYGGTYRMTNLLLAHRRCNEKRGTGRIKGQTRNLHKRVLRWLRDHDHPSVSHPLQKEAAE